MNSPLQKDEGLIRTVSVWGLSANIVNIVVRAGIFVLPAIAILWFLSHLTGQEAFGIVILIGVLTVLYFGMRWLGARAGTWTGSLTIVLLVKAIHLFYDFTLLYIPLKIEGW